MKLEAGSTSRNNCLCRSSIYCYQHFHPLKTTEAIQSIMARKCCSSCASGGIDDLPQPDDCMCGCGYFNGAFPIMMSQLLVLSGVLFSLAALGDCAFVEVSEPIGVSPNSGKFTTRRLGMLTFEKQDGQCYFWNDEYISVEQQIQYYIDNVLGSDWTATINLAVTANACGILLFLYLTSYCCSSQLRPIRYATGFMLAIVTTVLQGLTFLVYGTQWCSDNGCSFSRSAGSSVGAALSYFLAGLFFCATTDYPGTDAAAMAAAEHAHDKMVATNDAAAAEPVESRDSNFSLVEDGQQPWQTY